MSVASLPNPRAMWSYPQILPDCFSLFVDGASATGFIFRNPASNKALRHSIAADATMQPLFCFYLV
jgi:hypothetical protein